MESIPLYIMETFHIGIKFFRWNMIVESCQLRSHRDSPFKAVVMHITDLHIFFSNEKGLDTSLISKATP